MKQRYGSTCVDVDSLDIPHIHVISNVDTSIFLLKIIGMVCGTKVSIIYVQFQILYNREVHCSENYLDHFDLVNSPCIRVNLLSGGWEYLTDYWCQPQPAS